VSIGLSYHETHFFFFPSGDRCLLDEEQALLNGGLDFHYRHRCVALSVRHRAEGAGMYDNQSQIDSETSFSLPVVRRGQITVCSYLILFFPIR
jgi:hypothetical protein